MVSRFNNVGFRSTSRPLNRWPTISSVPPSLEVRRGALSSDQPSGDHKRSVDKPSHSAARASIPQISPQLQEIIYRALERNPANRYASAREFANDLVNPESVGVAERDELQRLETATFLTVKNDFDVRDVRDDSHDHFYPALGHGEAQLNRSETLRRGFGIKGILPWEHREVRKRYSNPMVTSAESNIRSVSEALSTEGSDA